MIILKIYDCFTFYTEFELLELRLKSLWNIVDYFVIVESNRTFSNKPKKLQFLERQGEFKEFFSKIRHVTFNAENVPYSGVGDWSIEVSQRNAIMAGLQDAQPDDLVFISDLDEIPAPDILKRIQENQTFQCLVSDLHPYLTGCYLQICRTQSAWTYQFAAVVRK